MSKSFLFTRLPPSCPLERETMLLLSAPIGISGLLASSATSLRHMWLKTKKKTGTLPPHCSLGPEVPKQSTSFSLPFRAFFCLSYRSCPGYLFILRVQNKKKYICSIFPEAEAQTLTVLRNNSTYKYPCPPRAGTRAEEVPPRSPRTRPCRRCCPTATYYYDKWH